MKHFSYARLGEQEKALLGAAKGIMETAYNPYSKFYVGAALLSRKGEVITGSNVENAAYGSTICAERAAILRANAMNIREFTKIAVIGKGENFETKEVTAPCGACRQMLYELTQISGKPLKVIMATTTLDKIVVATIEELLPLAFGPLNIGVDISKFRTS